MSSTTKPKPVSLPKNNQAQKPSVSGMTVQEERAALAEIRRQGENISPHYVLQNINMKAGDFALAYIMGQHAKRQDKHQRLTRGVNPVQPNGPEDITSYP